MTSSAIVSTLSDAATSITADATPVIAAAVGLGLVFWGAKVLWTKFKSMAK